MPKLNNIFLKKIFSICVFFLIIPSGKGYAQIYSINNLFDSVLLNTITGELSDYENGSSVSFLSFKIEDGKIEIINTWSSNSNSKKILDKFFEPRKIFYLKNKEQTFGTYIIPIIQIMFDDNIKDFNDLNWRNNDLTSLKKFGNHFSQLNELDIRFLNPVIIISQPPISRIRKEN
jgi:hypothetical protein